MADAENFLRDRLQYGPQPMEDLKKEAGANSISFASLRRAQKKLKVKAVKANGSKTSPWQWTLIHGGQGVQGAQDAQDTQPAQGVQCDTDPENDPETDSNASEDPANDKTFNVEHVEHVERLERLEHLVPPPGGVE